MHHRAIPLSSCLLALALLALSSGCDDGGGGQPPADDAPSDALDAVDTLDDAGEDTAPVCGVQAPPAPHCEGNDLITYAEGADGCFAPVTQPCGELGANMICDASTSVARCVEAPDPCEGVHECPLERRVCDGDSVVDCAIGADGCLDLLVTDCAAQGGTCDFSGGPPACVLPPVCDDEPCLVEGRLGCAGDQLSLCGDADGDGCLDLTAQSDCALDNAFCSASGSAAACLEHTAGRSCQAPLVLEGGLLELSGDDLVTAYGDAHSWLGGDGCVAAGAGDSAELIVEVALEANDTLVVSESGGLDSVRHIVAQCADDSACLASADEPEGAPLVYPSPVAQTVYVVLEAWQSAPLRTDFALRIEVRPAVCGDAILAPNEVCDDGNASDGDGCAADCQTIEAGYVCLPGLCYPQGSGDSCAEPIVLPGARTFTIDTVAFTDTYSTYSGCGGGSGNGPDVVFAVTLAPDEVAALAVDSQQFNAALAVATACPGVATSCLERVGDRIDPFALAHHNASGAEQLVYFVLDSASSSGAQSSAGQARLSLDLHPLACGDGRREGPEACDDGNLVAHDGCSPACTLEGDLCSDATPVTAPASVLVDTTAFTNDYDFYTACGGSGGAGPDRVLAVEVPPGELLRVSATPLDGFTAALVLSPGCPDLVPGCAAYGESNAAPIRLSYANDGAQSETVYVTFDGGRTIAEAGRIAATLEHHVRACGDGLVDAPEVCDDANTSDGDGCAADCLTVEAGLHCFGEPSLCYPEGSGDTCADAIVLPGAGRYGGNTDLPGYANDLAGFGACPGAQDSAPGGAEDLVFALTLGAGETLDATLVPLAGDNLALAVLGAAGSDCAAPDASGCLAYADTFGTALEHVSYASAAGETVYLVVDASASFDAGPFELVVDVR